MDGWSTDRLFEGHIWEALRCPFANYVLQKCVTVTDDHDVVWTSTVVYRFVVGCFFFLEIERDMMAMKWEMNLFLGLF